MAYQLFLPQPPREDETYPRKRWYEEIWKILGKPFKFLLFDTTVDSANVPTIEGTLSWNSEHHTLNIQPDNPNVLFQACMEDVTHVYNATASTLLNGKAVYITGTYNGHPTVALARANAAATSNVMGFVTADIPSGSYGFVTSRGEVHDFDTSAFTAGDTLYLSATTAGAVTKTAPIADNFTIPIAVALLSSATVGVIYVKIGDPAGTINATNQAIAAKDPTGFVDNTAIDVSYDSSARTITLTGDLRYYWRGSPLTLTSPWTSSAHTNTTGKTYYLSTSDGTTFSWSETAWNFYDLQVAFVNYGATSKWGIREVHGMMPHDVHEEFHVVNGCFKRSGGTLGGYVIGSTTAADRRPSVAQMVVKDEDLPSTLAALADNGPYTTAYLTGSTGGTGTFVYTTSDTEIVRVSGTQPYYTAVAGGVFTQTLMSNNSYSSIWLFATPVTSDAGSQTYRYIWLQGQSNGTLASEQALTPLSLDLGVIKSEFSEFVFTAQVIIQYTAANWQITQVKDLTKRVGL
jgi:hypothetical protein